ncbi:sensor histidine kinase [Vulcaniibacterium tengchongense]|uniref:histidine kinase n=1 Tax=Vulcaniibacterium tengchongense TaxID=1273429 RepID=A0A3N4VIZ4_9GAMM|nr:ATP-binding protein [Vulcaniibacterium tengchongense]RPE81663.1 phospho-acceptor domain-containing protein [Vulcaniibacterium tengchongense]
MSGPTAGGASGLAVWRTVAGWLTRVPIDDPVDRRNAPMLQIVLLLLGLAPPLLWGYRIALSTIPWRGWETYSLALSLSLSAVSLFSFFLIRRGRFRWALLQFLGAVAVVMMLSYAGNGFDANRYEQPVQMIWLIVAGLMLGPGALWLMYGWITLSFAAGIWRDIAVGAKAAEVPSDFIVDGVVSAVILLLIAVVVDRSARALRESLGEATRRGNELARANRRLQEEIAERERMQNQLIHAQKVEAVGRLASGVAHDFNHLLGLVLGYVERGKRADPDEEMRGILRGVESAARRATAIGQKLVSFSRQEIARPAVFDASEALREMRPMLRQLLRSSVELALDVPDRPLPVHLDRAHFELAVLNIAANADHAMPEGGRFAVSARSLDGTAEIELRDTGCGMSEPVLARVFEPFFTTKPSGQGTGLGLAVVRDVVVGAGGGIEVDSAPGRGSTFRIRLPLARAETAAAEGVRSEAEEA